VKKLDLLKKTEKGTFIGAFDVSNKGWGVAAKRLEFSGKDVGIAVLRFEP
jgi:hypothetical protein